MDGRIANLLPKAVESTRDQVTGLGGDGAVGIPKTRINYETCRSAVTWKDKRSHVPAISKFQAKLKTKRRQ